MAGVASDPCFDGQPSMLSVEQAIAALLKHASPVKELEQVSVFDANNRVLAEEIRSAIDVPGFDNSAMDGYALRVEDVSIARGEGLEIAQRIPAGSAGTELQPGTCARIFTGAPVPACADTVAIQEVCRIDKQRMFIDQDMSLGENIRPKGNDISAGASILATGTLLTPPCLGLIASVGLAQVPVIRKVKVAMFSSGDEIIEPGQALQPGQIYNSNRPLMGALLERQECEVIDLGTVPDTFEATREILLKGAGQADLVMSSGGVSVGEEDHIKSALESVGELNLWRIKMKPGKPLAFGKIGTTPFIGLPGNPVSVLVTFMLFARSFIVKLQGRSRYEPDSFPVRCGFDYRSRGRREYVRVHVSGTMAQGLTAECFPKQGSDVLSSAAWASGLVEVAENTQVSIGDTVRYLPFSEWL